MHFSKQSFQGRKTTLCYNACTVSGDMVKCELRVANAYILRVASYLYFSSYELHSLCELRVASCTYYASYELNERCELETQKCELETQKCELETQKVRVENSKMRVGNSKVRVGNSKVRVGNSKVPVETKSASCLFSFVKKAFYVK